MSLSTSGGSDSNLIRHMKSKHPLIPLVTERQTVQPEMQINRNNVLIEPELPSTISKDINPQKNNIQSISQQRITEFIHKPPPVRKVEEIDNLVLEMVSKGHHEFRIFEDHLFHKFISAVSKCPGYTYHQERRCRRQYCRGNITKFLKKLREQF